MNRRKFLGMFGASVAAMPAVAASKTSKASVRKAPATDNHGFGQVVMNREDLAEEVILVTPDDFELLNPKDCPLSKLSRL